MALLIPDEIRRKYLERRRSDADELSEAIRKGEFGPFARIGHQLNGNGPTYGYDSLADLGQRMEEAANRRDLQQAQDCFFTLKAWVAEQFSVGEGG